MVDQGENDLEDVLICTWKKISLNPNSTTFKEVRDETHNLYKCYNCIGVGINTCESYNPQWKLHKVNGDYR